MKKVLVTGAGGFLGARILDQLKGQFEFCTFPRGFLATADEAAVRELILREKPEVILHTAALSSTGYCEEHPEESYRANVLLAEWVAKAAAEVGAKLLVCSSDQVYSGVEQEGPLPETLPLTPNNVYGRHKLEMEGRVLAACPDAVLLRLSWMFDLPGYKLPFKKDLLTRLQSDDEDDLVFSSGDYRGVSYAREVIANLVPAMELPGGIYNFGSGNGNSMLVTVYFIAEVMQVVGFGTDPGFILDDDWERNLVMDTTKLESFGITFPNTRQALLDCMADYGLDTALDKSIYTSKEEPEEDDFNWSSGFERPDGPDKLY